MELVFSETFCNTYSLSVDWEVKVNTKEFTFTSLPARFNRFVEFFQISKIIYFCTILSCRTSILSQQPIYPSQEYMKVKKMCLTICAGVYIYSEKRWRNHVINYFYFLKLGIYFKFTAIIGQLRGQLLSLANSWYWGVLKNGHIARFLFWKNICFWYPLRLFSRANISIWKI